MDLGTHLIRADKHLLISTPEIYYATSIGIFMDTTLMIELPDILHLHSYRQNIIIVTKTEFITFNIHWHRISSKPRKCRYFYIFENDFIEYNSDQLYFNDKVYDIQGIQSVTRYNHSILVLANELYLLSFKLQVVKLKLPVVDHVFEINNHYFGLIKKDSLLDTIIGKSEIITPTTSILDSLKSISKQPQPPTEHKLFISTLEKTIHEFTIPSLLTQFTLHLSQIYCYSSTATYYLVINIDTKEMKKVHVDGSIYSLSVHGEKVVMLLGRKVNSAIGISTFDKCELRLVFVDTLTNPTTETDSTPTETTTHQETHQEILTKLKEILTNQKRIEQKLDSLL
jgi:hypothetical protein